MVLGSRRWPHRHRRSQVGCRWTLPGHWPNGARSFGRNSLRSALRALAGAPPCTSEWPATQPSGSNSQPEWSVTLTNIRTPAYYQGEIVAGGLGTISAIYPDGESEPLPIPTNYVIDGFTWGSATTESGRAAAASLVSHLADRFDTVTMTEAEIQRLAKTLIARLPDGQGWQISSLDVYLYLT